MFGHIGTILFRTYLGNIAPLGDPAPCDDRCVRRAYRRANLKFVQKKLDELFRLKPHPFAPVKCLATNRCRQRADLLSRLPTPGPRADSSLATPNRPKIHPNVTLRRVV
jgi:hypothetical protein